MKLDKAPQGPSSRRPLLVLGMHGPSVARTIGLLRDMQGLERSPAAERGGLEAFCDRLFAAGQAEWWKVLDIAGSKSVARRIGAPSAADLAAFEQGFAEAAWTDGDPRLGFLLPLFADFFAGATAVVVHDDPLEAAADLQARHSVEPAAGLALWEAYMTAALRNSQAMPRVLLDYSRFLVDPRPVLAKLRDDLRDLGFENLDLPIVTPSADGQRDPLRGPSLAPSLLTQPQRDLRDYLAAPSGKAPKISSQAKETLRQFEAHRSRETAAITPVPVESPAEQANDDKVRLAVALAELGHWKNQVERLEKQADRHEEERRQASEALVDRERKLAAYPVELEHRDRRLAELQDLAGKYEELRLAATETRLDLTHKLTTELSAERHASALREIAAAEAAREAVADGRVRLATLEESLERTQTELDGKTAELEAASTHFAAFRQEAEDHRLEVERELSDTMAKLEFAVRELDRLQSEAAAAGADRDRQIGEFQALRAKYNDLRLQAAEGARDAELRLEAAQGELAAQRREIARLEPLVAKHNELPFRSDAASPPADNRELEAARQRLAEIGDTPERLELAQRRATEAEARGADERTRLTRERDALQRRLAEAEAALAAKRVEAPPAPPARPEAPARAAVPAASALKSIVRSGLAYRSRAASRLTAALQRPPAKASPPSVEPVMTKKPTTAAPAAASPAKAAAEPAASGYSRLRTRVRRRLGLRGDLAILAASPLFDAEWYTRRYGDVARAKQDPLQHFARHGGFEGRDPGPAFSSSWYLSRYPDVKRAGLNPLIHYLRHGQAEGRLPLPPAGKASANPAGPGSPAGSPGPANAADVARLEASPLFDRAWYLATYGDVAERKLDPVRHYLEFGAPEGRDPGPSFSTTWYLGKYGDVRRAGLNPLVHYLRYGQKEGRLPVGPLVAPPALRFFDSSAEASDRKPVATGAQTILLWVEPGLSRYERQIADLVAAAGSATRILAVSGASLSPEDRRLLDSRGSIEVLPGAPTSLPDAVNRAIEAAGASDVVLVSARASVSPGLLGKLRNAAYCTDMVATATALSLFHGPYPAWINDADLETLDPAAIKAAASLLSTSTPLYPRLPVGLSACLYLRRDCLDEMGLLDAKAFPSLDDTISEFCLRAGRLGWVHVLDDATLIDIRGTAPSSKAVEERYPEFPAALRTFAGSDALKQVQQRWKAALRR